MSVRTRFAPSPTGYLHIGGVRTALFNYLFARHHGGQFVLRIDDTDAQRNLDEALAPILNGFRWLGIDWDEGPEVEGPYAPYFQSQRADRYQAAVEKLLERGHAYRDYARPDEIQAEREAAEKEKRVFVYSRRFMAETDEAAAEWEAEGRRPVIRLKMPREGTLRLQDKIRGEVLFEWAREQDHVIQRADGTCLYHLATVVDDDDFKITHVIRAEEHLSNTPRQVFIAESLGYTLPTYAHIPFVAEPGSKTKLSKRKLAKYLKHPDFRKLNDLGQRVAQKIGLEAAEETFNPVIVDFYEQTGFLPDAVVNYLLLLGWSLDDKTEDFSREEMLAAFSLDRVNKGAASFDPQKLMAFEERYFQRLPRKQKVARVIPFLQAANLLPTPVPCDQGDYVGQIVAAAGDRLRIAGDILDYEEFFMADDAFPYDEKAFTKRITKPEEAVGLLRGVNELFQTAEPFEAESLEVAIKSWLEEQGFGIGKLIHALRVATTGKAVGFGLFEVLEILGRKRVRARIERAVERASA